MWTAQERTVKDGETTLGVYIPEDQLSIRCVKDSYRYFWSFFTRIPPAGLAKAVCQPLEKEDLQKRYRHFFPQIVHPFQIEHRIPDVLGNKKPDFDGKVTMVVGSGASAATVLQSLKALGTSKVPST